MFIFHELKLIYIRVPATGSSSFLLSMKEKYKCEEVTCHKKSPVVTMSNIPILGQNHFLAKQAKCLIDPQIWDSYEKISFIRHPYRWVVSMYNKEGLLKVLGEDNEHYSLSDYVKTFQKVEYSWFLDDNNKVLVDTIYRTKDLDEFVFDRYGIRKQRYLPPTYPRRGVHDLTEDDKKIIRERCYRAFEHFKDEPDPDFRG